MAGAKSSLLITVDTKQGQKNVQNLKRDIEATKKVADSAAKSINSMAANVNSLTDKMSSSNQAIHISNNIAVLKNTEKTEEQKQKEKEQADLARKAFDQTGKNFGKLSEIFKKDSSAFKTFFTLQKVFASGPAMLDALDTYKTSFKEPDKMSALKKFDAAAKVMSDMVPAIEILFARPGKLPLTDKKPDTPTAETVEAAKHTSANAQVPSEQIANKSPAPESKEDKKADKLSEALKQNEKNFAELSKIFKESSSAFKTFFTLQKVFASGPAILDAFDTYKTSFKEPDKMSALKKFDAAAEVMSRMVPAIEILFARPGKLPVADQKTDMPNTEPVFESSTPQLQTDNPLVSQTAPEDYGQAVIENENKVSQDLKGIQEKQQETRLSLLDQTLEKTKDNFSKLADVFSQGKEKQSSTYRTMFALQQGFAIASSLVSAHQAYVAAFVDPTKLTVVDKLLGAAKVMSTLIPAISAISSLKMGFANGGFTGYGAKYQVAGVVHKGEGVLSQMDITALGGPAGFEMLRSSLRNGTGDDAVASSSYTRPQAHLAANRFGKAKASPNADSPFKITINNYGNDEVQASQDENGNLLVVIGKMVDGAVDRGIQRNLKQGYPLANAIRAR